MSSFAPKVQKPLGLLFTQLQAGLLNDSLLSVILADLLNETSDSAGTLFALGSDLGARLRFERPCLFLDEPKNLAQDFFFGLRIPHHPLNPSKRNA